ncbi:mycothione reductase [Arthrobacter sp. PAMC 25486]|uniref:mycothione reductase n=1 Tax=Arthrobacter sp. PAMC 25486 TaxID=1494608 RepID=UPI0005362A03|nr:mycothione reductase [Arthrobacter sp. PAMC 25486]AIY00040.1 mycothione reductase [Arthrobacter sp. PAMC 25486]
MPHFDLVIIGTGSGNSIPGPEFDHWNIAIVEDGLFGGTCLNVGCIPTKMFVHPAELADAARHGSALGINAQLNSVDWPGIRDRIFGRIDAIEDGGRKYREGPECPNITVFAGRGRFTGHKALHIDLHDGGTSEVTADRFVLAAGSHAVVPDIPGLASGPDAAGTAAAAAAFHTSDTIMRLEQLPTSIVILGGGYIAAEFAHVFSSFGVHVTQIARGKRLLKSQDADVSAQFTKEAAARYTVLLETKVTGVANTADGVELQLYGPGGPHTLQANVLLVATGRKPNGASLDVEKTGVRLDGHGRVVVDAHQQTDVEGIYALGDISSKFQLKHVANHEAKVVKHNLAHPEAPRRSDHRFVPAAVFTDPQIASVGITEDHAVKADIPYAVKVQQYADIAAGWAREDSGHFLKVLADPATGLLLGAHVIGPEAATVIQPLIQAMHFGQKAQDVARNQYWIHPALSELVENALLGLPEPRRAG